MIKDELTIEERAELDQLKSFMRARGESATAEIIDSKTPEQQRGGLDVFRRMHEALRRVYDIEEGVESGVITQAEADERKQRLCDEFRSCLDEVLPTKKSTKPR